MFFLAFDPQKFKALRIAHTEDAQTFANAYNELHPEPLHISKQNLSHWESGKHLPNYMKLRHVMRYMAKTMDLVESQTTDGRLIAQVGMAQ